MFLGLLSSVKVIVQPKMEIPALLSKPVWFSFFLMTRMHYLTFKTRFPYTCELIDLTVDDTLIDFIVISNTTNALRNVPCC